MPLKEYLEKNQSENRQRKMAIFATPFRSEMGAIKDLLVGLGKEKEAREIDKEYQRRKFFGPWGLKELAELYEGHNEEKLRSVSFDYCKQSLLKGLADFAFELKNEGFLVGVLSSDPQFLLDNLKQFFPLDFAFGTQLEFKGGIMTGKIQKEVNRYTKVEILKTKKEEFGVGKEDIITFARASIAHLPLAKESGVFVGFDPVKDINFF